MQLTSALAALSLALPLPLAAPTNITSSPTDRYYLKTQVFNANSPDKDSLYVGSWHTGAGTADAVLSNEADTPGFLNATYQQFELGDNLQWGFVLDSALNYAGWEFVYLDAVYGQGTPGFYFNESGLQVSQDQGYGFSGWLVCDWWHGVPQLFWRVYQAEFGFSFPSTCVLVNLVPVPINDTAT
ncbi:hypothetical protein MMC21_008343 [Puttea exsequens]|nr:hypothetical protein [Puttea exsequens]